MSDGTFDIRILQKQATPKLVGKVIGTGTSATRVEFFIAFPFVVTHAAKRPNQGDTRRA